MVRKNNRLSASPKKIEDENLFQTHNLNLYILSTI